MDATATIIPAAGRRRRLLIRGYCNDMHQLCRGCCEARVCFVFCHPIYSGRQTSGRTSRGHTGGRFVCSYLTYDRYASKVNPVALCVCVGCGLSSHLFWKSDLWTHQPRGHTGGSSRRISPPSFCGACLNFFREKDPAVPFPRRP